MPKIGRFPPFGKRFFKRVRKLIGSCHFSHFWRVVMALAAIEGRKSLSRITGVCKQRRTRQALSLFLTEAQWDASEILLDSALTTLRRLGWQAGDSVYVVIDDTQKKKRGKKMDAVSKIFLHAEKVYAQGHTIVGCAFVYRGVVIPCAIRLWACEKYCEDSQADDHPGDAVDFRKLTELAADCIEAIRLPSQGKAIVLFDSYYLCPTVLRACKNKGFRYVGAAKKNRTFRPDGRPFDKKRLSTYGPNTLRRLGRWHTIPNKKNHRLADRVGDLSRAGRVKLVFSRRKSEGSWIALATNETRWNAKTVLQHYLSRWPIEVLFKMSKQHLGLGDYQVLRYRAVERYLHLVMIAHLLLTHLACDKLGAKAIRQGRRLPLRLPSVAQMQHTLRSMLWDDAISAMEQGSRYAEIGKKLKDIIEL